MGTLTPNYNLYKPAEVGEFVDVGNQLNDNYDIIDTQLKVNADTATAIDTVVDGLVVSVAALDTRIDTLEASDQWLNFPANLSPGLIDDGSRIRKIAGKLFDFHLRAIWDQGPLTVTAGGNFADVDICSFSGGVALGDIGWPFSIPNRTYTGTVGNSKYIATYVFVSNAGEDMLRLTQVDSNDEGNIVNGDVLTLDCMFLIGGTLA